ncbi:hypothetical protein PIB30_079630, partial [Stylosanthes scabra]|nr:hypothetical protein [Stylosanthes scabra]
MSTSTRTQRLHSTESDNEDDEIIQLTTEDFSEGSLLGGIGAVNDVGLFEKLMEVSLRYERIGIFCTYCGHLGHDHKFCQILSNDTALNGVKDDRIGEWIRADQVGKRLDKNSETHATNSSASGNPPQPSKKPPLYWLIENFSGLNMQEKSNTQTQLDPNLKQLARSSFVGYKRRSGDKKNVDKAKKICLDENYIDAMTVEGASLQMAPRNHDAAVLELSGFGETPDSLQPKRDFDWFIVDPNGVAGGLALAWRDGCNVCITNHDSFFIVAMVTEIGSNVSWGVLGVHLSSADHIRMSQYEALQPVIQQFQCNVLLMGDFNAISNQHEKK